jgi:membrane glycosyltransferase
MGAGLVRDGFRWSDALIFALFVPNVAWIAFGASTTIWGLIWGAPAGIARVPAGWRPAGRTAVLIPARNEDVAELTARVTALRADLGASTLAGEVAIFILSDSDDPHLVARETQMVMNLAAAPVAGVPTYYRRRSENTGRKPGNIGEWLRRWGGGFDYMLTLDADSEMSARRITRLVWMMESRPDAGLVQAGLRLVGAETRFGRLQQLANRLYGGVFAAGVAGWTGNEGNYWGHNALIRVRAFAEAAGLPRLPGQPPFGGDVLSHDFVEAAWLRRAGWSVIFDPEARGSAEGGPQTLGAFHKRDRRWCQGNMQHLRIVFGAEGLHPVSRVHLVCGIGSYLAAPLWLGLVVAATLSNSTGAVLLPAFGALALILLPKLAGVLQWARRRPRTSPSILGLAVREIAMSTLLAPILMVRQTIAVVSVLAGQDCGWKPAGGAGRRAPIEDMAWVEPAVGGALLLAVLPGVGDLWQLAFILPIVLPLFAAPLLTAWLDLPRGVAAPRPELPARSAEAARRAA